MAQLNFQDLHEENLLSLYDVVLDIDQERQLSSDRLSIPLMRTVVRFPALFPGDSIGTRDRYCELRWKAIKFLERLGVINNVRYVEGNHRWFSNVEMDPNGNHFPEFFRGIEGEYFRRNEATKDRNPIVKSTNERKVFVVHGRDLRIRDGMFTFLRTLGLEPIEWSEAVALTGKAAPYIGQILQVAFSHAQAIVVLLTGDDEARLREQFRAANEVAYETDLTPQARPNVLFEAGMAMSFNPERTVLVEFGPLRPFSDVAGRHAVKMNGSSERRQELAQRLQQAGCPVNMNGTDWHSSGDLDPRPIESRRIRPNA